MFWRFGFHNPSAIDTLLDREDIELEDILEEEDLLQEAKSHNQKLIDLYPFFVHPWSTLTTSHAISDAVASIGYPSLTFILLF